MITTYNQIHQHNTENNSHNKRDLRKACDELEVTFLNEMFKIAGLAQPKSIFSGGPGETQFAGFLTREYARNVVSSKGIGLSEILFRSMVLSGD